MIFLQGINIRGYRYNILGTVGTYPRFLPANISFTPAIFSPPCIKMVQKIKMHPPVFASGLFKKT
jgi:hypothetical protein